MIDTKFCKTNAKEHPYFVGLTKKLNLQLKEMNVYRLYQNFVDNEKTSIILCNYYKIVKYHNQKEIIVFEWKISKKAWVLCKDYSTTVFAKDYLTFNIKRASSSR